MRSRPPALRLEELETRLLLTLPSAAPPLGPPPPPSAGVVWVNTEGGLQAALNNLQSGQTVVIQKGTYNLSQTGYIGLNHPVANVTVRGETDNFNDVVLLGQGMENAHYGNVPIGLAVYNAQNVTIENLSIGQVYWHPIQLKGESGADQVHIYHVRLFDAGEQFLKGTPKPTGGGVTNSDVQYSVFEYTVAPPVTDHGGGTGYTNGVDVHGGSNWVIRNNLFRNFHTPDSSQNLWNPAVLMWNHSANTTVEGNTFIDTDRAIALGLIHQASGYDHQGGIIRNNFVYQSPGLFSAWRTANSDAQIIAWDSPNTEIYHNTVLVNGNTTDSIQLRWTGGADVRNNLADVPVAARDGATFTQGGNYFGATVGMFVNAAVADLHLVLNAATQTHVIGQVAPLAAVPTDWDGNTRPPGVNTDLGASLYTPVTGLVTVLLDDGQAGYSEKGSNWNTKTGQGYNGELRYHAPGTNTDNAAWQFNGLPSGSFDVQVTWTADTNRATNATYQVYDGSTLLETVTVNQQKTPTGQTVNGSVFQSLSAVGGAAVVNSGLLKVVLSGSSNGYVLADAVRLVQIPPPMVDLNWVGGGLTGPSTVSTPTPFTVTRAYTISGAAAPGPFTLSYYLSRDTTFGNADDVLLGTETLSSAADLAVGLHTGTSPLLQVNADGPVYLYAKLNSGGAFFETDLGNNVTPAPLPLTASGPVVLDDGQWGFAETGGGWFAKTDQGYGGELQAVAPGGGANTATWQVPGLTAGSYDVQVTWTPGSNRASNAAYKVYDGALLLGTVAVNQQKGPTGTLVNGSYFQSLGQFTVASGTLKVVLSDNANGYVLADALRVAPTLGSMSILQRGGPVNGGGPLGGGSLSIQGGQPTAGASPEGGANPGNPPARTLETPNANPHTSRHARLDQWFQAFGTGLVDAFVD